MSDLWSDRSSRKKNLRNLRSILYGFVVLGGLLVSVFATGPKVRGWMDFKGDKIRSTTSFGGEVKPSVPCRRFTACKIILRA
jgi:hypothetical protein